jgi:hypothetical protein
VCHNDRPIATSWFEIVELLVAQLVQLDAPSVDRKGKKKGKKATRDNDDKPKEAYFDKHLLQLAL